MRNSKKKSDTTPLPDQDTMGSDDDYAPGASQGDGQSGDPAFASSGDTAATSSGGSTETTSDTGGRGEPDLASERDRYLRLAAEYDNYRKPRRRSVRTPALGRRQTWFASLSKHSTM